MTPTGPNRMAVLPVVESGPVPPAPLDHGGPGRADGFEIRHAATVALLAECVVGVLLVALFIFWMAIGGAAF